MSIEKSTDEEIETKKCPKIMLPPRYRNEQVIITVTRKKTTLTDHDHGTCYTNGFTVTCVDCPFLKLHENSNIRTTCKNYRYFTKGDITHIDLCYFNDVFT